MDIGFLKIKFYTGKKVKVHADAEVLGGAGLEKRTKVSSCNNSK